VIYSSLLDGMFYHISCSSAVIKEAGDDYSFDLVVASVLDDLSADDDLFAHAFPDLTTDSSQILRSTQIVQIPNARMSPGAECDIAALVK
jgi:hypothetical protein